ncbi:MAG: LptF/LptG family permease [Bacteroidetes bacterium]|nr:LptF/LptG family permease [Bacteroidota bacterium]MBI3423349.1 LptF/LptG family permease [Acidobacteriota bacterium]
MLSATSINRLVPRYLILEILPLCLITLAILTILVLCQQLSRNSELLISPLITWQVLFQTLASLLPPIFTFTLPVAIVISEIVTLSRFVADHEWGVFEASGLNWLTKQGPFICIGVVGFVLTLLLNWNIAPQAIAKLKDARNNLALGKAATQIKPQTFVSEFPGLLFKVKSVDQQTGRWNGILLLRKDEAQDKIQLLAAKSGSLAPLNESLNFFELRLSNGVLIDNLLSTEDHITSVFKENIIKITPAKHPTSILPTEAEFDSPVQLSSMSSLISRLQKKKPEVALHNEIENEIEVEVFKRVANAFACIFASLCVLVLTNKLHAKSARRSFLLLSGFLLLVIFHASITYCQNLALRNRVISHQSLLLGFLAPCLTLVTLKWILTKNYISMLSSISTCFLRFRRTLTFTYGKKDTLLNRFERSNRSPSFNLGHYLVISEFAKFFALILAILAATIILFTLLDIAPSLVRNNVRLGFALSYLAWLSPQVIYYIIPFSILLAVATTATALARTGQLTILFYYTTHPLRLTLPIIIAACSIFLGILFLSETFLPFSNRQQDNRYRKIKGKTLEDVTIAFDRQWVSDEDSATIFGYRLIDNNGNQRLTALIFKLTNPDYYLDEVIHFDAVNTLANSAYASASFRYKIGDNGLANFEFINLSEPPPELINRESLHERANHEANKMTSNQLQNYILQVERTGLPTTALRMEQMQKIAFPFACITLLFLAFPVCLLQIRRQYQSRFSSIAISAALALLFWGILSIFEAAGKRGTIPISIAAWSPHALFLALASTIQVKLHYL